MEYKLLAWNCQGISNKKTISILTLSSKQVNYLKELIDIYKINVVILLEPRVSGITALSIIKTLGMAKSHRVEAIGFSGGIWILWHHSINVKIIHNDWQFIHMHVIFPGNISTHLTSAY
jgi:hypothetical protein